MYFILYFKIHQSDGDIISIVAWVMVFQAYKTSSRDPHKNQIWVSGKGLVTFQNF